MFRYQTFRLLLILCSFIPAWVSAAGVVTSSTDKNLYDALTLDNGLRVLLISDPEADKSAASLDVNVGSGSDPDDRGGLAHFLEHMLFLGTETYPQAGDYQKFIKSHGGRDNAYTSFDHTNYFFEVEPDYLEGALDRFAQFFVAPKFNEEFVQRERAVVHSEYTSRLNSDGRRIWAARKMAMNPAHPQTRFSVGSLETLADREGDSVRDDLIEFYNEFYSANLMTLTVLGREDLSVLRQWVEQKFGAIPNRAAKRPSVTLPMYEIGKLPIIQHVIPEKSQHRVSFVFPVPPTLEFYTKKPLYFIGNLLGHEGEGSVLAALKERGWAEGLSAGAGMMDRYQGTFEVSIVLTEAGVDHLPEIGTLLFDAINLFRDQGIEKWIYEEQHRLADIAFWYKEKRDSIAMVRTLSARLHDYPIEDVLYAPYHFDEFDADLITRFFEFLTPENLHVLLIAPDLETDRIESDYQVPYSIRPLDEELLARWTTAGTDRVVGIPAPNPFIPEDLALLEPDQLKPVRIPIREGFELWYDRDTEFGTPKANFYFSVRSPLVNASARSVVLTELFTDIVADQLNAFSYPATLAGLGYEIYRHQRGFSVRVEGYNDRQAILLEQIVAALVAPDITLKRFERLRNELARELANAEKNTPYTQAISELRRLVVEPSYTPEARLKEVEGITREELEAFAARLFDTTEIVALSHGNVTREGAVNMAEEVAGVLMADSVPTAVGRASVVRLPAGVTFSRTLDIDHNDSAITLYLQGGSREIEERARFYLTSQFMETAFYHEIRTRQQMGYIVFGSAMPIMQVPGLAFVVQSPSRTPEEVEQAIEVFLADYQRALSNMPVSDFERNKHSLVSKIMSADTRLSDRSDRYWSEIDRKEFEFDSREQLVAAIEKLDKSEFERFFQSLVSQNDRSRMIVRSFGSGQEEGSDIAESERVARVVIEDAGQFRLNKPLFPSIDAG